MKKNKEINEHKKPFIYFGILIGTIMLIVLSSVLFIMISTGSIIAGEILTKFGANDNPYELILNEEIFNQLEKHNLSQREGKAAVPRIIKITIEEILHYYNIKDEVLNFSTGENVLMYDYVSAVDLVEPFVIFLKSQKIVQGHEELLMEELLRLPYTESFVMGLTGLEITEYDIEMIVYRPLDDGEFYVPGTGGTLARLRQFEELEDLPAYIVSSNFYRKFYDMRRRTLDINPYYQVGQPYSQRAFPSVSNCGDPQNVQHNTIANSACGPMSFAMVVSHYKKVYNVGKFPNGIIEVAPHDPSTYIAEVEEVVHDFCQHHPTGGGTSMYAVSHNKPLLDLYGVQYVGAYSSGLSLTDGVKSLGSVSAYAEWIYKEIINGHPLILLMRGPDAIEEWDNNPIAKAAYVNSLNGWFLFSGGGHYVVVHGYDINGNLIFTDPARPRFGEGFMYPWKEALYQSNTAWAFGPIGGDIPDYLLDAEPVLPPDDDYFNSEDSVVEE